MDKQEKRETITIKINGQIRPLEEKDEENSELKKQFGKNPDDSMKEMAAAKERDDDAFEWILPNVEKKDESIEDFVKPAKTKRKKMPPIRKNTVHRNFRSVILIIFFAVIVGTGFGMFILNMVTSETIGENEEEKQEQREETAGGALSAELPPMEMFVVQGGMFSAKEGAEQEMNAILEKNVPAAIVQRDGSYYVYVGVGDSLERAKELGASLRENGVETYAKEVSVSAISLSGLKETDQKALELAPVLFEKLVSISSAASTFKSIPEADRNALAKEMEEWNKIEKISNEKISNLKKELDEAAKLISSGQTESEGLAKIQQHLLNFIAIYHSL